MLQGLQVLQQADMPAPEPPERVHQRAEPMALHQGLARQAHQPAQALGRDPHHAVAVGGGPRRRLGRGLNFTMNEITPRFSLPALHPQSQGRSLTLPRRLDRQGRLGPPLLDGRQVGHEGVDLGGVIGLPGFQVRLGELRDPDQHIDAAEEDVHMPRPEGQLPLLGRDEAVLHRVGDPDGDVEPDDPRRPLERVGRAHQGLDDLGRGQRALQGHESRQQRGGVALRLHAEQLQKGESAQVAAHGRRLRITVGRSASNELYALSHDEFGAH